MLLLCTSASDDVPKANKRGLVWNFQPLDAAWAAALALLAVKQGLKQIAAAGPNNGFSAALAANFRGALKGAGGKLVNEPFFYNTSQPSYHAEVDRLLRSNLQAVFIPGYVTDYTAVV